MSAPPSLSRVGVARSPAGEADAAEVAVGQHVHGGDRVVILLLDLRPEEIDALRDELVDDVVDRHAGDPADGDDAVGEVRGAGVEPVDDVELDGSALDRLIAELLADPRCDAVVAEDVFRFHPVPSLGVVAGDTDVHIDAVAHVDLGGDRVADGHFLARGEPREEDVRHARLRRGPTLVAGLHGAGFVTGVDVDVLLLGHWDWLLVGSAVLCGNGLMAGEFCGREDRAL